MAKTIGEKLDDLLDRQTNEYLDNTEHTKEDAELTTKPEEKNVQMNMDNSSIFFAGVKAGRMTKDNSEVEVLDKKLEV